MSDTEGRRRLRDKPLATLAIDGGGLSAPRLGHFIAGKNPGPVVQYVWWASGPVWTGKENLAPNGNRSPVLPAHRKWLLRYPGCPMHRWKDNIKTDVT